MPEATGRPTAWIEGCVAAHADLLADLEGLTDQQAAAPSLLPDWTVGHLLSHIARNCDSTTWRLEGAALGEVRDQYPGGLTQRSGDIEVGAGRSAADLVDDVRTSAETLERVMSTLPDEAWDGLSRGSLGGVGTSRDVVFSRWREVVVHHGDLGLRPVPLPPALVQAWLPDELEGLAERTDPAQLLAWLLGRGPAPHLDPW
jgi:maleylpyruvate isomerase